MPEAARDDGTCLHGRIDADAIIYEGWLIRFDASEGRNNTSSCNCRQKITVFLGGGGDWRRGKMIKILILYIMKPKDGNPLI